VESVPVDVPAAVLARLGPHPANLSRSGSSVVLRGRQFVLKRGPADRMDREGFALDLARTHANLTVPAVEDSGPGWLLLRAIEGMPWRAGPEPLVALGKLHRRFLGSMELHDPRLRDVLGGELLGLLSVAKASEPRLPEPLASVLKAPSPLIEVIADEPPTLVHGDAWPGNVLGTSAGPAWLDWEEAGVAPAPYDLAVWLHGSPWVPPSADPPGDLRAYARGRGIADIAWLERAVDAITVLLFLALDVANLARGVPEYTDGIVGRRNAAAVRVLR
jgi:hypothetical protein